MLKRQKKIITNSTLQLVSFLKDAVTRPFEIIRIAKVSCALFHSGIGDSDGLTLKTLDAILSSRKFDGGWNDPEETAWGASFISQSMGQNHPTVQAARKWLNTVRLKPGGWGRHARDHARIPITALIAALLPDAFKDEDLTWLQGEWAKDFKGPVRLSYKAGFYLLATAIDKKDDLVERTISHLVKDQNDDGGFAPWRNHPIGSDPWSTGVVLWGLSRWVDIVEPSVFERALAWLEKTQLPSGYWPYHYLDDGTSLALIGAVSAMKAIAGAKV